ncbi:hypothetical protein J2T09_004987 [Neorhizobium huautlense]|uniref:Uncharacterized protein n=1 Tax=Neorhizobium huautlense TaxID=67774 RepID=A0ABT9Q0F5_9HYPH|nr:hypothetical protein [Neorhizobium huautlense]MDP9840207.1 hypothetical protein [Neorhizobium huautlense]
MREYEPGSTMKSEAIRSRILAPKWGLLLFMAAFTGVLSGCDKPTETEAAIISAVLACVERSPELEGIPVRAEVSLNAEGIIERSGVYGPESWFHSRQSEYRAQDAVMAAINKCAPYDPSLAGNHRLKFRFPG